MYHDLHGHVSYLNFKSMMYAARRKNVPPVPRNLNELGQHFMEYRPLMPIFKGMVTAEDESTGVMFIHDSMIDLSRCTQLFCDGTYKVCM